MALRDDVTSHWRHLLRRPFLCIPGVLLVSPYHFLQIRHLSCRPQHTPATWILEGKYDGFGSTIVHWNCSCLHRVARTRFQSNSVVWTLAIHPSLPKEFDERVATLHFPALGARSMSLPRNNQILSASRLKPLSGYSTHVRGEARAWRSCRWSRPWLGEVRINWRFGQTLRSSSSSEASADFADCVAPPWTGIASRRWTKRL